MLLAGLTISLFLMMRQAKLLTQPHIFVNTKICLAGILLLVQSTVIPDGKPESSAMDGKIG